MADVFLSYAREDRDRAQRLASALESHGWSVWWDRNIVAGQTFDQVIEHELDAAKRVVVLWSMNSIASEWVKNEAAVAAERGVLVPVLIDKVKLPLEFRRKQTADLVGWDGDPSHEGFQMLCQGLVIGDKNANVAPPTGLLPSRPQVHWNRSWTLGLITAIIVVAGIGAYLRQTDSAPKKTVQSYPMTCRGGGALAITNDGDTDVHISFQPGAGPAALGLAPGQCTWADRALRPGEPTTICDDRTRAAQYVGLLTQSDQYVTVQVYNDRFGCMRVAQVGNGG